MQKLLRILTAAAALCWLAAPAQAAVTNGQPAPDFTIVNAPDGPKLSDLKGKTVVLEWTNHDCPFVRKFYDGGEMQRLQRETTGQGVVWVSIISSAAGKQGHVSEAELAELQTKRQAAASYVVRDESGAIGKMYGARTTPHMFVIDAAGLVQYQGAIDSIPSTNSADIAKATNYVTAALADLQAGRAVATPSSRSYGCSVKYAE